MSSVSSSSAVDGLISGLDTASIITKLLAVDAAPQTQLKNKVTAAQAKVTAYQSVNTKVAALEAAAKAFTSSASTSWSAAKATVTGTAAATATATSAATSGSLSFTVDSLAAAKSVMSPPLDLTDPTTDVRSTLGIPLDVVQNGKVLGTVNPSNGTLDEVTAAINKVAGLGLSAVAVRISANNYRLQITSDTTGLEKGNFDLVPWQDSGSGTKASLADADGNLTVSNTNTVSGWSTLSTASDARITIPTTDGSTSPFVTSSTNTFSDVMPGVTISATSVTPKDADGYGVPTTVTVGTDTQTISDSVQALVDAANAALTEIATQSKAGVVGSDGSLSGAGALNGDSSLRALKSKIIASITNALGDGSSAAKYGLQSTTDGRLTFDATTFSAAYTADPKAVRAALSPTSIGATGEGVFERLQAVAKAASDKYTGTLTTASNGQANTITDLTKRISDWDTRLAAKKEFYSKYYANLEVALGKLQSQSTWLSGQLSSLSSSS